MRPASAETTGRRRPPVFGGSPDTRTIRGAATRWFPFSPRDEICPRRADVDLRARDADPSSGKRSSSTSKDGKRRETVRRGHEHIRPGRAPSRPGSPSPRSSTNGEESVGDARIVTTGPTMCTPETRHGPRPLPRCLDRSRDGSPSAALASDRRSQRPSEGTSVT